MNGGAIIVLIAAIGRDRGLGKNGKLLWHISDDMLRFKELTMGHPVVMGRKTFESIGKPLPGRTNVVVTRDRAWNAEGVVVKHSVEEALEYGRKIDSEKVYVIGGGEIYAETLERADLLELTLVHDLRDASAFFPEYEHLFTVVAGGSITRESGGVRYTWQTLRKNRARH